MIDDPWAAMENASTALTSLSAERDEIKASRDRSLEKLLDAARKLDASEAEACDMRTIISECAKALGNGAHIDPACTVEFMRNLPEEIRLLVSDLRRKLEEARKALEPFAEACPKLFNDWCPDETPAWWIDGDQPGDENRSPISVGDFRAAARALSSDGAEHG